MLVNYSSSSDSEPPQEPSPKKRKKLPVPFEKVKVVKDDPVQHGGRKRQVEHTEGNWASHIFIEPEEEFIKKFKELFDISEKFQDIKAVNEPHVSLSKLFILKHHWIDNFFNVLTKNVKFEEFHVEFSTELRFLSNEDKTRHFACVLIEESCREQLRKIVDLIDETLKEFELPIYYEDSIFHMSILWKLTEFTDEEKEEIKNTLRSLMSSDGNFYSVVDKITFKTGNKIKFLNCS